MKVQYSLINQCTIFHCKIMTYDWNIRRSVIASLAAELTVGTTVGHGAHTESR